jgi:hypothetical protein
LRYYAKHLNGAYLDRALVMLRAQLLATILDVRQNTDLASGNLFGTWGTATLPYTGSYGTITTVQQAIDRAQTFLTNNTTPLTKNSALRAQAIFLKDVLDGSTTPTRVARSTL